MQIGCERKTIGDLVNSISTGRLSGHQLPGLLESYHKVYLFVEGVCRENKDGELEVLKGNRWIRVSHGKRVFSYKDVWSYLTTLETMCGIVVRTTANMAETARQIEWLHYRWSKPFDKHRGHLGIHKLSPPQTGLMPKKASLLLRMASELPGIGWDRARAVEKHFGNVRKMFEAPETEWRQIEGIGKLTSRKVWEGLHD